MERPTFISIQNGAYWLNVAHIVSIEVNGDDSLEVSTNDGHGPYTVDDAQEIEKLKQLIEVVYPDPPYLERLRLKWFRDGGRNGGMDAGDALWFAADYVGLIGPDEDCPNSVKEMDPVRVDELVKALGWDQ